MYLITSLMWSKIKCYGPTTYLLNKIILCFKKISSSRLNGEMTLHIAFTWHEIFCILEEGKKIILIKKKDL